ncbi:hypothetical protein ONE63_009788 [Megalurothrips usitatus]|uniref:BRCT domain-containing protein n=1 Tax=Megalurothrips usitatus TaxID=439358 RepID=A0AAV7XIM1_9NEOP|nr:hypothetical protein ONE63_009788 [Megalurothrips usitatus]
MSQLYQLFCEGIKSRVRADRGKPGVGLSSTQLFDSQDDPAAPDPDAAPAPGPVGDSPHFSVRGQVGSATPTTEESPPLGEPPSPKPARVPTAPQEKSLGTGGSKTRHKRLGTRGGIDYSPNQSSRHLMERNPNVSPVDFVDVAIAIKRRDEALGSNRNDRRVSSEESQNSEPPESSRKQVSDSSETDFEGADEYYRKHLPASTSIQTKPVDQKIPAMRREESASSRKSPEESINLVLESVSPTESSSSVDSTDTDSESVEVENIESPSAARCRAFPKHKWMKSKSPERLPLVAGDTRNECDKQPHRKRSLAPILEGVKAYVEVRSGHDNRSMGVKTHLRTLGATVLEKLSKEVTHVIFNEGSLGTLRRAQNQQCYLVSVLWIDECEKVGQRVPEDKHPPLNMHLYNELKSKKYRKMKSLQPDFEEGKGEERLNNYIKRFRQKAQKAVSSQQTNESLSSSDSDESTDETQSKDLNERRKVIPDGIVLKELSVILNRVDATDTARASMIMKHNKRRLMPLNMRPPSSLSLEDFDPKDRLNPGCPYNLGSAPKQQSTLTQRQRPPRKIMSASVSIRRRSSCFVRGTQRPTQSQSKPKKARPQMRTMVCTFMHRRDIDVVAAVIKQLGGWILEPTVSVRTTHVVCGDSKRTINLLRGIAHGCWILHQEWVMRSLEAGHWLDEEPFELTEFPAVQQCRVARETLGVCPDIFSAAGGIFVANDTTPPRADIMDLLTLCGAKTVKAARQAKVIVGHHQKRTSHSDVALVNEQWVLDSIQENMLQPVRRYRL